MTVLYGQLSHISPSKGVIRSYRLYFTLDKTQREHAQRMLPRDLKLPIKNDTLEVILQMGYVPSDISALVGLPCKITATPKNYAFVDQVRGCVMRGVNLILSDLARHEQSN